MAAFTSQNVIGPAGGLCVHRFNPDPLLDQWPEPGGLWKSDALAAAENYQFWVKIGKLRKMDSAKLIEVVAIPVQPFAARPQHQAAGYFFTSQANPTWTVSTDGLHTDEVRLNFHGETAVDKMLRRIKLVRRTLDLWSNYRFRRL